MPMRMHFDPIILFRQLLLVSCIEHHICGGRCCFSIGSVLNLTAVKRDPEGDVPMNDASVSAVSEPSVKTEPGTEESSSSSSSSSTTVKTEPVALSMPMEKQSFSMHD